MSTSSENSATPWLAFLVGIAVVGLLVVGFFAFNGQNGAQEIAALEQRLDAQEQRPSDVTILQPPVIEAPDVNLPDVEINPPAQQEPAPEPAPVAP